MFLWGKSGKMTIKFGFFQRNLLNERDPMIYVIFFQAQSLRQCRVPIGDRFPCTHTSCDCTKRRCCSIAGTIGPLYKLKSSQILHGLRHGVFSCRDGHPPIHMGCGIEMAISAEFAPGPRMAPVSPAVPRRNEPGSHEMRLTHLDPTPICMNFGPNVLSKRSGLVAKIRL